MCPVVSGPSNHTSYPSSRKCTATMPRTSFITRNFPTRSTRLAGESLSIRAARPVLPAPSRRPNRNRMEHAQPHNPAPHHKRPYRPKQRFHFRQLRHPPAQRSHSNHCIQNDRYAPELLEFRGVRRLVRERRRITAGHPLPRWHHLASPSSSRSPYRNPK